MYEGFEVTYVLSYFISTVITHILYIPLAFYYLTIANLNSLLPLFDDFNI